MTNGDSERLPLGRTRKLPFDWDRFFIPSRTECVLACYAMSARYWKSFNPELNLPADLEAWKEFAAESFIEYRGTSIRDIMRKTPRENPVATKVTLPEEVEEAEEIASKPIKFLELVIKPSTPSGLEALKPFFETKPPIPQILVFDQLLMTHNITGNYHAILLYSLDFEKEKLFVIDPSKYHLLEPYVYDFSLFQKAWRACKNLQIITYPKDMITVISGPSVGIVHQTEITKFMEGNT